jgi:hypothetical protein
MRRPLDNDAGEVSGVLTGRRRLGHTTALDAGLVLLPFKLNGPDRISTVDKQTVDQGR